MAKLGGLFEFEYAIMLAPMGVDVSGPEVVAAVANAGGIATLSSPVNNYEATQKLIKETKKLTKKPFGAGILLEFDNTHSVQAIFDEKLAFMQVFWGDYPKEMVDEAHKHGLKVFHQVGSLKDAEKAIAAGVDCIVAQGVEAGGHSSGTVSVMALVPRVVDLAREKGIPVLAAGSITDPRGYVAALALGARGISMGTRFVASKESKVHDYYKQQLLKYTEADTDRTDLYSRATWRAPVRCLNTPFHLRWRNAPEDTQNDESQPIIAYTTYFGQVAVQRRFDGQVANHTTAGELENMVMYAGQGVGLVKEILPAGEIVRKFVEEAREMIRNFHDSFLKPEAADVDPSVVHPWTPEPVDPNAAITVKA